MGMQDLRKMSIVTIFYEEKVRMLMMELLDSVCGNYCCLTSLLFFLSFSFFSLSLSFALVYGNFFDK